MEQYYQSKEYKTAKGLLKDEYAVAYQKAATYIHTKNIYGIESEEGCLQQIMDDFLTAQAEGKPLSKITGTNLRSFCDEMLKAESKRSSQGIAYLLYLLSFSMLVIAIYCGWKAYVISEERLSWDIFNHIRAEGDVITFLVIILLGYVLKRLLSILFFHHAPILKTANYIIYFLTILSAIKILEEDISIIKMALPIPAPLYFILTTVSLIAIILSSAHLYKYKSKWKKMTSEEPEDEIEKRNCPACNRPHDWDYPVCPYCKHRYKEASE